MRRSVAFVTLATVVAVAVPALPAAACSPPPNYLVVSRETVAAGQTLVVNGDDYYGPESGCKMPPPRTFSPSPSETVEPTETPEPTETVLPTASVVPTETATETATPSESATATATPDPTETTAAPETARVGAAYRPPYMPPVKLVTVTIARVVDPWKRGPAQVVGSAVPETKPTAPGVTYATFSTRVTVPASLAPGTYELEARMSNVAYFGTREITVVESLPATGSRSASLVPFGALLVLAGVIAVAAGRPRATR